MENAVSIEKCLEKFTDTFSPKIVAELNNQLVMLVKAEGDWDQVPWHTHDDQDEMFLVIDGVLEVQERSKNTKVNQGEFYIVNKGVEHRAVPRGHVKHMIFTQKGFKHTGEVEAAITKKKFAYLEP